MGQLDHLRTVLSQLGNEAFQSSPGVISNFSCHEYARQVISSAKIIFKCVNHESSKIAQLNSLRDRYKGKTNSRSS